ncbi:Glycosyl transferase, family 20 [Artemisia annua]|uniref:Glycosyl transferase, family 20 n=1 Tax=Artemisia annua TaxID=35608 RepID=A0A2U1M4Q2_ARTAN|nr:Glycosyl transferase, family 20 [Artemisia annua]
MNATKRRISQFKEKQLNLHLELKEPLEKLCDDPKTTVVILSGSHRSVFDEILSLATEHGFLIQTTNKKWIQNLTKRIILDLIVCVKSQAAEWALLRHHVSEDLFGVQICGAFPNIVAGCASC